MFKITLKFNNNKGFNCCKSCSDDINFRTAAFFVYCFFKTDMNYFRKLSLLSIIFLYTSVGFAQVANDSTIAVFDKPIPKKVDKELQFFAYFYNQYVRANYFPTNDFLRGQIFGRMFGQNTTTTSDSLKSSYFEQRLLPFFIYTPKLLNGKAILRTSFEIDYTWGDVAYGVGGNFGGAVSADQVNIQTQNIELELIPAKHWAINLGLQRMFDNPSNAYRTLFEDLTNTGYRLMYWGTDATGINLRYDGDFQKFKFAYWQLYENSVEINDDVVRYELMYDRQITKKSKLGGSLDYVRDRASGEGGPSILGQGLNSTLSDYNGSYRFPISGNRYRADVLWAGLFYTRNSGYVQDRFMLTGFANYNFGTVDTLSTTQAEVWGKRASIGGLGLNVKTGYRYGKTANDIVQADFLYSTGDENSLNDDKYSGVLTGNNWGAPVSIFISSGSYILFPHGNVVNRFVALVNDFSNLGYGLTGGVVSFHKDIIPHKFNAKISFATAFSNVTPPGGSSHMGTEANFKISYTPNLLMNLELHGAYLSLGDFYKSRVTNGNVATKPVDPWTVFVVYKWLMF